MSLSSALIHQFASKHKELLFHLSGTLLTQALQHKSSEVTFSSLVSGNTTSSGYSSGGVVYTVSQKISEQGQIETTSSSTNIALNGSGFFVVSDQVDSLSSAYVYSRNGDFLQFRWVSGQHRRLLPDGFACRFRRNVLANSNDLNHGY